MHDLTRPENFMTDGWQTAGSRSHPVILFLVVHGQFSEGKWFTCVVSLRGILTFFFCGVQQRVLQELVIHSTEPLLLRRHSQGQGNDKW